MSIVHQTILAGEGGCSAPDSQCSPDRLFGWGVGVPSQDCGVGASNSTVDVLFALCSSDFDEEELEMLARSASDSEDEAAAAADDDDDDDEMKTESITEDTAVTETRQTNSSDDSQTDSDDDDDIVEHMSLSDSDVDQSD